MILPDPAAENVNVPLHIVPEPRVGKKNRFHLDLCAKDQHAEVERLLRIGAAIHPRTAEPDEDYLVLADPEGNLSASSRTIEPAEPGRLHELARLRARPQRRRRPTRLPAPPR